MKQMHNPNRRSLKVSAGILLVSLLVFTGSLPFSATAYAAEDEAAALGASLAGGMRTAQDEAPAEEADEEPTEELAEEANDTDIESAEADTEDSGEEGEARRQVSTALLGGDAEESELTGVVAEDTLLDLEADGESDVADSAAALRALAEGLTDGETLRVELDGDITLGTDGDSGAPLAITAQNATLVLVGDARLVNAPGQRHIYISNSQDLSIVFEGVTLEGDGTAGGMHIEDSGVTVSNATISGNTAVYGAGIYLDGGSLVVRNSLINGNSATHAGNAPAGGGGIYATGGAQLTLVDSTLQANTALNPGGDSQDQHQTYGGAVYMSAGTNLALQGNILFGGDNEALGNKAAAGGGIYFEDGYTGALTLEAGMRFVNNRADVSIVYAWGGAIAFAGAAELTVNGAELTHNNAHNRGGAVYMGDNSTFTMHSGTMDYNTGANNGGAALSVGKNSTVTIYGGTLNHNETTSTLGAAITTNQIGGTTDTGLVALYGGQVNHNSITGTNSAGAAIYCNDILIDGGSVDYNHGWRGFASAINCSRLEMKSGSISYNTLGYANYLNLGAAVQADYKLVISGGDVVGNKVLDFEAGNNITYGALASDTETVIIGGRFEDNSAHYGGALGLFGNTASITGGEFVNNTSYYGGGAIFAGFVNTHIGGNASFTGNNAYTEGGAILKNNETLRVDGNASFVGNTADTRQGGAIAMYANNSTRVMNVLIEGEARFEDNVAPRGGAVAVVRASSDAQYPNAANSADSIAVGGTVRFAGNQAFGHNSYVGNGGAVFAQNLQWLDVAQNVSFADNKAVSAYWMQDEDDIAQHDSRIAATQFTDSFPYGYNNNDINYTDGELVRYSTVVFDLNYEGGGVHATQTTHQFRPLSQPAAPQRAEYTFTGWHTEAGEAWDFANGMVDGDMTLYAEWEGETITTTTSTTTPSTSSEAPGGGSSSSSSSSEASGGSSSSSGSSSEASSGTPSSSSSSSEASGGSSSSTSTGGSSSGSSSTGGSSSAGGSSSSPSGNGGGASVPHGGIGNGNDNDNNHNNNGNHGDNGTGGGNGGSAGSAGGSTGVAGGAAGAGNTAGGTVASGAASASQAASSSTGASSQAQPEENTNDDDGQEQEILADHETVQLDAEQVPVAAPVSGWGFVNLILALLALAGAAVQLVSGLRGPRRVTVPRIAAIATGLLPLLCFLLLEHWTHMQLVNQWTPLCTALFVVHAALFVVAAPHSRQNRAHRREE